MAYNEDLAERVRAQLGGVKKVTEPAMFGGLAWMVAGNMACGLRENELIVRVGPDLHHDALTRPGELAQLGPLYRDQLGEFAALASI